MKKITITTAILTTATAAQAQDLTRPIPMGSVLELSFRIFAIVLCMYLVGTFIITIVKLVLDHQLKSRMVDRGFSASEMSGFFRAGNTAARNTALKWFAVLSGVGFGLMLITFFQPLGMHSLVIMTFSVAAAFLLYAQFIKRSDT